MKYPFLSESSTGIRLALHVQTNASRSEIVGNFQDRLKIKIQNGDNVVNFLAQIFAVEKADIEIISGETGKNKFVAIRGATISQALQTLSSMTNTPQPSVEN